MPFDWTPFLPPNTPARALPNWRNPRLYLSTYHPLQRWKESAFYPASRLGARLYRFLLRLKITAGIGEVRTVNANHWPLGEFVSDALPPLASTVILMGTQGPAQEVTVQLRDKKNHIRAYLKYAEKPAARKRLKQELFMLSNIPSGLGPEPIKFGLLGSGDALIKSALEGRPLSPTLPPPTDLLLLLESLVVSPSIDMEAHPWIYKLRYSSHSMTELDSWLEPLADKSWPVVIQHGDFVPWNLLRAPDGKLRIIDWEYGTLQGFPYLDLAHYLLQTSALIYRRSPMEAKHCAVKYLVGQPGLELTDLQAQALVHLAAYDSYRKTSADGQLPNTRLQAWRRSIWESKMW